MFKIPADRQLDTYQRYEFPYRYVLLVDTTPVNNAHQIMICDN